MHPDGGRLNLNEKGGYERVTLGEPVFGDTLKDREEGPRRGPGRGARATTCETS